MLIEIKVIVSEEEPEAMRLVKDLIDEKWSFRKDGSETVYQNCKFMLADDEDEYVREELKKRLIW